MRRLALLLPIIALGLHVAAAQAAFTAATLVSGNAQIPFEEATSPALSQDGRYVVFRGTIDGDPGVYRRDLQTGALEAVAAAANPAIDPIPQELSAPDAAAPSISADGRYVAFTSTAELDHEAVVPAADHGCPQVYVRDMTLGPEEPGAYVLASAIDSPGPGGARTGIEYVGGCPTPLEASFNVAGAQAAAGVALSADGRRVAFTVLSPSDLTAGGSEGGQVAVRDLDTGETTLVSEAFRGEGEPAGEAPRGGGAYPSATTERSLAQLGRSETFFGSQPTASSASISADGSTVAWLGTDVPQQVPSATDVTAGMSGLGGEAKEVEPLWRRIADGPAAVTKRLLGAAGLNLYFTESHNEVSGVEGGTLYVGASSYFVAPTLDADGTTVATIANAPTAANQVSYAFTANRPPMPADAYLIHVNGEPASQPQVTPLTATPSFDVVRVGLDGVVNLAISPDGSRLAFDTRRTSFALAPPSLISPPAPETAFAYSYEVNVGLGTLEQVTSPLGGGAPNGEPGSISLSADGQTLAFSSSATNLIFGTPTAGVSQVYVAHELPDPSVIATQSVTAPPVTPTPSPDWILDATASVQADGSVIVEAEVPGAGRLAAALTAQLPRAHASRRRPGASAVARAKPQARHAQRTAVGARKRAGRRRAGNRRSTSAPMQTTVARAATVTGEPQELSMRLRLSARYRPLLYTKNGLYCLLRLTFASSGGPALSQLIPVTVHARRASVHVKRRHSTAGGAHSGSQPRRAAG